MKNIIIVTCLFLFPLVTLGKGLISVDTRPYGGAACDWETIGPRSTLVCANGGRYLENLPTLNDPSEMVDSSGGYYGTHCAVDQGKIKCWGEHIVTPAILPKDYDWLDVYNGDTGDSFCVYDKSNEQIQCFDLTGRLVHQFPNIQDPNRFFVGNQGFWALGGNGIKHWDKWGRQLPIPDLKNASDILVQNKDNNTDTLCAATPAGIECLDYSTLNRSFAPAHPILQTPAKNIRTLKSSRYSIYAVSEDNLLYFNDGYGEIDGKDLSFLAIGKVSDLSVLWDRVGSDGEEMACATGETGAVVCFEIHSYWTPEVRIFKFPEPYARWTGAKLLPTSFNYPCIRWNEGTRCFYDKRDGGSELGVSTENLYFPDLASIAHFPDSKCYFSKLGRAKCTGQRFNILDEETKEAHSLSLRTKPNGQYFDLEVHFLGGDTPYNIDNGELTKSDSVPGAKLLGVGAGRFDNPVAVFDGKKIFCYYGSGVTDTMPLTSALLNGLIHPLSLEMGQGDPEWGHCYNPPYCFMDIDARKCIDRDGKVTITPLPDLQKRNEAARHFPCQDESCYTFPPYVGNLFAIEDVPATLSLMKNDSPAYDRAFLEGVVDLLSIDGADRLAVPALIPYIEESRTGAWGGQLTGLAQWLTRAYGVAPKAPARFDLAKGAALALLGVVGTRSDLLPQAKQKNWTRLAQATREAFANSSDLETLGKKLGAHEAEFETFFQSIQNHFLFGSRVETARMLLAYIVDDKPL